MPVYASALGYEQHVEIRCKQQEQQNRNGDLIYVFAAGFFLEQFSKAERLKRKQAEDERHYSDRNWAR